MINEVDQLLLQNKAWAADKLSLDEQYFEKLSYVQTPKFLWIGCSDSRVPANEITGTEPGEIFVHRNVANLVVNTDLNMLSVLKYAVEVLKVEHVIVCGHYGCGGIKAALQNQDFGFLNKWLRNIKDVIRLHEPEILSSENPDVRADRLVEWNVREQVYNLAKTTIIQEAWYRHHRPTLHGWVYSLDNGILTELCRMQNIDEIDPIYRYDFSHTPPHP